ncbi:MAG: dihydrodipicolinate synthase family protein [Vicinamibacterales bacterium]
MKSASAEATARQALEGILTPIATPFTSDDAVDEGALRRNVAKWMATPLHGLVVLGSNGEAPQLEDDEADRIIGIVRDGVPASKWLLAGTGRESTKGTIAATKRAAALGADAALVRTPSFFKPQLTADIFVRHYTEVADASPIPILLYNVTMFTGVSLPIDAVEKLAVHPNIVGMKESGSDIGQIAELVARTPDDFTVLGGSATMLLFSLSAGCAGAIVALAMLVPELCVELWTLVREGKFQQAHALQRRLMPLARSIGGQHGVPGVKAALDAVGYEGGYPRPPLRPVPANVSETIRKQLDALSLSIGH